MIIEKIAKRFGYRKIASRSAFKGAQTGNLYSGWTTTNFSADALLRTGLRALRARSRELEINNDYAKKFFRMVKTNVIGDQGIKFQSQALTANGKPDHSARAKIEDSWKAWQEKKQTDVAGESSFIDIQNLVMGSIARDGEVITRKVRGYDNKFNFALQLIEADHLDENYNDIMPGGNRVKMGKEFDKWNRPVAYHLFKTHPGDVFFSTPGYSYGERERIPADEILHLFTKQRISQSRGIPWMHAALTRLNMLGGYEEAELVAARLGAAKGGFYKQDEGSEYVGDDTEDGAPISEADPGHFELLPKGLEFQPNDPTHPTTAFKDFEKAILRGISSGLDVSYNYLANDLEGVNYSSIRAGVLDERDVWKAIQRWVIEQFTIPIFKSWLSVQLLNGNIKLPFSEFDRWQKARWQPRRWLWVDPLKDVAAKLKEIEGGLTAPSYIVAEMGGDYEEIIKQAAEDQKLRKTHGIKTDYDLSILEALLKLGVDQNEN